MLFTAVSCSMRRDLYRIQGYFKVIITVPTFAPSEFRSRVTIGTFELDPFLRKNINTFPTCNTRGRQLISPVQQVLEFLWSK